MPSVSNPRLVAAIAELLDASDDPGPRFRAVLEALLQATLLFADEDGEPAAIEQDEEVLLALFTDSLEANIFAPGADQRSIKGEDAIRYIAEGEYDGILLNPRGRQFLLTREDIDDVFEID